MKILALERELPDLVAQDFEPHLISEAAEVWKLYQDGVLREIYFRQDWPGAVLMLECESVAQADKILGTLPLVRENLIAFELIPLGPYPGFSRLFTHEV